jgi:two-component system, chemotaxis family, chemotaxis protein CheY
MFNMMAAKILIVEDDADSRDMLAYLLAGRGFEVICAEDGKKALELIEKEPPGLIITDISMPVMDGIEMIERLREHSEWREIPVLVMSAFRSEIVNNAMQAGANAATVKPLEIDKLMKLITHLTQP